MTANKTKDYEFTQDWFTMNINAWDLILPRFSPAKILEIGSYEGRATCYFIEKFANDRKLEIHCIDTWEGGAEHRQDEIDMCAVEHRFDRNVALAISAAAHPVTIVKHKARSVQALARMIGVEQPEKFDIIYVDGSHTAADVLTDGVLAFQLLRLEGLMIFDDYLMHYPTVAQEDPLNTPKIAVDAFVNTFARRMRVMVGPPIYQIFAVKIGA